MVVESLQSEPVYVFERPVIGRSLELDMLAEELKTPGLVTISGTGGVGKTTLARELAHKSSLVVGFVGLVDLHETHQVLPAIARSLGASDDDADPAMRIRQALIGSRRVLVLDNLEHLEIQSDLEMLLDACPELTILATSRRPLRVPNERVVSVEPFAIDRLSIRTDTQLRQLPAIALFCQSASVPILDRDLPAVAVICERVGGLPLAIELAAARMKVMSPEELLERFQAPLSKLHAATPAQDARHQSMRMAISWSYDLLSPDQQSLFRRIALFSGGFSLDMAERIVWERDSSAVYPFANQYGFDFPHAFYLSSDPTTGDPGVEAGLPSLAELKIDVPGGLEALIEHGLLQRYRQPNGESRYSFLETIREFGVEALHSAGEWEGGRHAHAALMLALFEAANEGLYSQQVRRWSHERLEEELPNLRVALEWSISHGESTAGLAQRLAGTPWMFWQTRGRASEGRRWMEAAFQHEGPAWSHAIHLPALGFLAWIQGDDLSAERWLNEGKVRAQKERLIPTEASAYFFSALVLWRRGPEMFHEMARSLVRSISLYESIGDKWGIGACSLVIGITERMQGHIPEALASFERAGQLHTEVAYDWGIASALFYRGDATLELVQQQPEKMAEALSLLADALQGYRRIGDWWGIGGVVSALATVATRLQLPEPAARFFGAAAGLLTRVGAFLPPANLMLYQAVAEHLKAQMGEQSFAALFAEGLQMPSDQVVEMAEETIASLMATSLMVRDQPLLPSLTRIQLRAVQMLADGCDVEGLAEKTDRSVSSAYELVGRICIRLGVKDWREIGPTALRLGLVSDTVQELEPLPTAWKNTRKKPGKSGI